MISDDQLDAISYWIRTTNSPIRVIRAGSSIKGQRGGNIHILLPTEDSDQFDSWEFQRDATPKAVESLLIEFLDYDIMNTTKKMIECLGLLAAAAHGAGGSRP